MTYPSHPRLPFPPASSRQSAADQNAPYVLPAAQPAPWAAPPTSQMPWSPPVPPVPVGPEPVRVPYAPSSLPLSTVIQAPPERRSRGSRASTVALLVATLVATGGVSFAVGRWSTGEAGSGSPAIAAGPAIDLRRGRGWLPGLAPRRRASRAGHGHRGRSRVGHRDVHGRGRRSAGLRMVRHRPAGRA